MRAIEIVDTCTIGDESVFVDEVQEILDHIAGYGSECSLCPEEAFYDEVAVPVILPSESDLEWDTGSRKRPPATTKVRLTGMNEDTHPVQLAVVPAPTYCRVNVGQTSITYRVRYKLENKDT